MTNAHRLLPLAARTRTGTSPSPAPAAPAPAGGAAPPGTTPTGPRTPCTPGRGSRGAAWFEWGGIKRFFVVILISSKSLSYKGRKSQESCELILFFGIDVC